MAVCTHIDIIRLAVESDIITKDNDISNDISLADQGIDSLDKFKLFATIEEKYNLSVPDEDLDALDTIDQISSYVNEKLKN